MSRLLTIDLSDVIGQAAETDRLTVWSPRVRGSYESQDQIIHTRRVSAGSVISVQAKADHSNSLNRQITNASFDVTWIDGTDVQEG